MKSINILKSTNTASIKDTGTIIKGHSIVISGNPKSKVQSFEECSKARAGTWTQWVLLRNGVQLKPPLRNIWGMIIFSNNRINSVLGFQGYIYIYNYIYI